MNGVLSFGGGGALKTRTNETRSRDLGVKGSGLNTLLARDYRRVIYEENRKRSKHRAW
jgi:hypothetical protein